ncbi:MAG TPA: hypothetical protein VHX86_13500 [Tepidisphaeraceae bacterium]|jgi:hypothetical protein|nr:hypothetical protein [Tepidisphaeraceae bacterium]
MNRRTYYLAGSALIAAVALIVMHVGKGPLAPAPTAGKTGAASSARAQSRAIGSNGSVLPEEYAFFQTRSPFGGGQGHGGKGRGGPEALFIFRGAVRAGTSMTAFMENVTAKDVVQVVVGDSLARGRIKSIDLDAIQYETAGNAVRIEVGQNLNGEAVQPAPTTNPSNPAAAAAAPAQNRNASKNPQAQPASNGHP